MGQDKRPIITGDSRYKRSYLIPPQDLLESINKPAAQAELDAYAKMLKPQDTSLHNLGVTSSSPTEYKQFDQRINEQYLLSDREKLTGFSGDYDSLYERAAEGQSSWVGWDSRAANAFKRFVPQTMYKLTEQIGYAGGAVVDLFTAFNTNYRFENSISSWAHKKSESWGNYFPVYERKSYKDAETFWGKIFNAEFAFKDVFDGFQFLATNVIGGKGLGLAGKGVAAIGGASAAGKATAQAMTQFYGGVGLSALGEAGSEASETLSTLRKELVGKLNPETGKVFTPEEIDARAKAAASTVWNYNVGLLSLSQSIQLAPFLKSKATNISQKFLDDVYKSGAKAADLKTARTYMKNIGINMASESLWEENFQSAVQRVEKNWAMGYGDGGLNDIINGAINNSWYLMKGIGGAQMSSDELEAATAMAVGGIIGAFGGAVESGSELKSKREQIKFANDLWSVVKKDTNEASKMFLDDYKSIFKPFKNADGTESLLDENGKPRIDANVFQKLFYQHLSNKNLATSQFIAAMNGDPNHMLFNREMAAARAAVEIYNASKLSPDLPSELSAEEAATFAKAKASDITLQGHIDKLISETVDEQLQDKSLSEEEKQELAGMKTAIKGYIELYQKFEKESKAEFVRNPDKSKDFANQLAKLRFYNETKLKALEQIRTNVANEGKDKAVEDIDALIDDTKYYINEIDNNKEELFKRYDAENNAKAEYIKRKEAIKAEKAKESTTTERRKELQEEEEKLDYEANEKAYIHGVDYQQGKLYNTTEFDILDHESKRKDNKLGAKHQHFYRQGMKEMVGNRITNDVNAINELAASESQDPAEQKAKNQQKRQAQKSVIDYATSNKDVIGEESNEAISNNVTNNVYQELSILEEEEARVKEQIAIKQEQVKELESQVEALKDPENEEKINYSMDEGSTILLNSRDNSIADRVLSIARELENLYQEDETPETKTAIVQLLQELNSYKDKIALQQEAADLTDKELSEMEVSRDKYAESIIKTIEGINLTYQDSDAAVQELQDQINALEKEINALQEELKGIQEEIAEVNKVFESAKKYEESRKAMLDDKKALENMMLNKRGEELERYFQRQYANRAIDKAFAELSVAEINPDAYSDLQGAQSLKLRLQDERRINRKRPEVMASKAFQNYEEQVNKALEAVEKVIVIAKANEGKKSARQLQVLKENAEIAANSIGVTYDTTSNTVTITNSSVFDQILAVVPNALEILNNAKSVTDAGVLAEIVIEKFKDKASAAQLNQLESSLREYMNGLVKELTKPGTQPKDLNQTEMTYTLLASKTAYNYVGNEGNPQRSFTRTIAQALATYFRELYKDDPTNDPFFKFDQTNDYSQLVSDIEKSTLVPENVKTYSKQLIGTHRLVTSLFSLAQDIHSTYKFTAEFEAENKLVTAIAEQPGENSTKRLPTFQQLAAIRQVAKFFSQSEKVENADNAGAFEKFFAYLKGIPGTGKTTVILKWVTDVLGIKKENIYSFSHNENSSKLIGEATGTTPGSLDSFKVEDLNGKELVVIDEIGFFNATEVQEIFDRVNEENAKRHREGKKHLRVIMLGDPSQITKSFVSPLEMPGMYRGIRVIDPITVPYRTDVMAIEKAFNAFDRNVREVKDVSVFSNTEVGQVFNKDNATIGVQASNKFDLMRSFLSNRNSGRSKVIIVNTQDDVARYTSNAEYQQVLKDNPDTVIEVLPYDKAQGRTFGEVYIDLDREGKNLSGQSFSSELEYNKAMFTMISRAQQFVFIVSDKLKSIVDPEISQDKDKTAKDIAENFNRVTENFSRTGNLLKSQMGVNYTAPKTNEGVKEDGTVPTADSSKVKDGDVIVNGESLDPESDGAQETNIEEAEKDETDPNDVVNTQDETATPVNMGGKQETKVGNEEVLELTNPQSNTFSREKDPKTGKFRFKDNIKPGAPVVFVKVNGQTHAFAQVFNNETNKYTNDWALVGVISNTDRSSQFWTGSTFESREIANEKGGAATLSSTTDAITVINKNATFDSKTGALQTLSITSPNSVLIGQASIKASQGLAFEYSNQVQPNKGFIKRIVDSFKNRVLNSIGGISKIELKIFNSTESKEKNSPYLKAGFTPKPGVPYLIVHSRKGNIFYVRLTPKQFTKNDFDSQDGFLNPIKQFMEEIRSYNNSIVTGMDKTYTLGHEGFNNLMRKFAKDFERAVDGKPRVKGNNYTYKDFTDDLKDKEKATHLESIKDLSEAQFNLVRALAHKVLPMYYSYTREFSTMTLEEAVDKYNEGKPESEQILYSDDMSTENRKAVERELFLVRIGNTYRVAKNEIEYLKITQGSTDERKGAEYKVEYKFQAGEGLVQKRLNALARTHSKHDVIPFRVERRFGKSTQTIGFAKALLTGEDSYRQFFVEMYKYLAKLNDDLGVFTASQIEDAYRRGLNLEGDKTGTYRAFENIFKHLYAAQNNLKVDEVSDVEVENFFGEMERKFVQSPITLQDLENVFGDQNWSNEGKHSTPSGKYLHKPIMRGNAINGTTLEVMKRGFNSLGKDVIVYDDKGNVVDIDENAIEELESMVDTKFLAVQPTRVQLSKQAATVYKDLTDAQVQTYAESQMGTEDMRNIPLSSNDIAKVQAKREEIEKAKKEILKSKIAEVQEQIENIPVVDRIEDESFERAQELYDLHKDILEDATKDLYLTDKAKFIQAVEKQLADIESNRLALEKAQLEAQQVETKPVGAIETVETGTEKAEYDPSIDTTTVYRKARKNWIEDYKESGRKAFDEVKRRKAEEDIYGKTRLTSSESKDDPKLTLKEAHELVNRLLPKKLTWRKLLNILSLGLIKDRTQEEVVVKFVTQEVMDALSGGKPALGLYKDRVAYVLKEFDAKTGKYSINENTIRHEIFHKIWNEYLTPTEKSAIRMSVLRNLNESERAKVESLDEVGFEEYLADKFQVYRQQPQTFFGRIASFFKNILTWFNWVKDNRDELTVLFSAISEGRFTQGKELFQHVLPAKFRRKFVEIYGDTENMKEMVRIVQTKYATMLEDVSRALSLEDIYYNLSDSIRTDYFKTLRTKERFIQDNIDPIEKDILLAEEGTQEFIDLQNELAEARSELAKINKQLTALGTLFREEKQKKSSSAFQSLHKILDWMFPTWAYRKDSKGVAFGQLSLSMFDEESSLEIEHESYDYEEGNVNLQDQIEETDRQNREGKLSAAVKMLLGMISYNKPVKDKDGNWTTEQKFIPGSAAFVKMVEAMESLSFETIDGVTFEDRFKEAMARLAGISSFKEEDAVWINSLYKPLYDKVMEHWTRASRNPKTGLRRMRIMQDGVPTYVDIGVERAFFHNDRTFVTLTPSKMQELGSLPEGEANAKMKEYQDMSLSKLEEERKKGNVYITTFEKMRDLTIQKVEGGIEYYSIEDFIGNIAATYQLTQDVVRGLWRVQDSRNTLAEFANHFTSLRDKQLRTMEIVNKEGHKVIRYIGAIALSNVDATRSHIETAIISAVDDFISETISGNITEESTKSVTKRGVEGLTRAWGSIIENLKSGTPADAKEGIIRLLDKLQLNDLKKNGIPSTNEITQIAQDLAKLFEKIEAQAGDKMVMKVKADNVKDIEGQEEHVISVEEVLSEQGSAISRLARLLTMNDEWVKSASVRNSEGNTVYLKNLSTQADDIFNYFIKSSSTKLAGATGGRHKLKQPAHLSTPYFSHNIFVKGLNRIKDLFDHDGIRNKATERTISYDRENFQDWMSRVINAGFIDGIRSSGSEIPSYYQSVYTLAHRKQMRMVRVDILDNNDILKALESYIDQVSARPFDLIGQIKAFDPTKHSNFEIFLKAAKRVGLTSTELSNVVFLKQLSADKALKAKLVQEMNNQLELDAVEFAQKLVDNKVPFTADVDTAIRNLWMKQQGSKEQEKGGTGKKYFKTKYNMGNEVVEVKGMESVLFNEEGEKFVDVYEKTDDGKVYKLSVRQMLPLVDIMYKNMYVNGFFLNQTVMGDSTFFDTPLMQIKRMAVGFAPGQKGLVNAEFGMKPKFKAAILSDVSEDKAFTSKFLTRLLSEGRFQTREELVNHLKENGKDSKAAKALQQHDELYNMFGRDFDWADGQGFVTPERAEEFVRGFGRAYNIGNVFKGVHYENIVKTLPNDQVVTYPVSLKYSSVVLTDELVEKYPPLAKLRDKMRDKNISEAIFTSGVKVGNPTSLTNGDEILQERGEINDDSVIELSNDNFRMQLNPSHNVEMNNPHSVANPSQLGYFLNVLQWVLDSSDYSPSDVVYQEVARLIRNGASEFYGKFYDNDGSFNKSKFLSLIRKVVTGQGNERILELIEEGVDYNSPHIVNKIFSQIASQLGRESVQLRFPGEKLVLQSSFGVKINYPRVGRNLPKGVDELSFYTDADGRMVAEVIVPRNMFTSRIQKMIEDKQPIYAYADALGFRIPSTELHSAVALKVVGFYDSKGTNVVIAPKELVPIHGSDFDVDSLFVIHKEHYTEPRIKADESKHPVRVLQATIKEYLKNNEGKVSAHIQGILDSWLNVGLGAPIGHVYDAEKKMFSLDPRFKEKLLILREFIVPTMFLDLESDTKVAKKQNSVYRFLDKLDKAYSRNKIIDTYLETITNPKFRDRMLQPISKEDFNGKKSKSEFADGTMFKLKQELQRRRAESLYAKGVINKEQYEQELANANNVQQIPDLSSPLGNYQAFKSNMEGLSLVGVFANAMKSLAYMIKAGKAVSSSAEIKIDKVRKELSVQQARLDLRERDKVGQEDKKKLAGIEKSITTIKTKISNLELKLAELAKEAESTKSSTLTTPFLKFVSKDNNILDLLSIRFNGKEYNRLTEFNDAENRTTWQVLDALVNAAIDNVKDQILPVIGANGLTANSLIAGLSLGVPLKTMVLMLQQPSIVQLQGVGRKETLISNQLNNLASVYFNLRFGAEQVEELSISELLKNWKETEKTNGAKRPLTDEILENGFISGFDISKLDFTSPEVAIQSLVDQTGLNKNEIANLLENQMKVLVQFGQLTKIGEDIANLSSALNIVRQVPGSKADFDSVVEKWKDVFTEDKDGNLQFNEEFSFQIPNFFEANPHIKEAYDVVIKGFSKTISDAFVKHRKGFEEKMYDLFSKMKLKLDSTSQNKSRTLFVDEFVRMIFTSIPSMRGQEIQDAAFSYWTGKAKDNEATKKTIRGPRAWSQVFAERLYQLIKLSKSNPDLANNRFLRNLVVERNTYNRLYEVRMAQGNLQYHDIIELQEDFKKLSEYHIVTNAQTGAKTLERVEGMPTRDGYSNMQHDFVRFAVINFGLKFSSQNYSMVLPPDIIKPYVEEMVGIMTDLVDNKDDKGNYKFEKLLDYFSLQAAVNNAEDLPYVSAESVTNEIEVTKGTETIMIERNKGYDSDMGIFYDIRFKNEGQNFPEFIHRNDWTNRMIAVFSKIEETDGHAYYKLLGYSPANRQHVNYYLDADTLSGAKPYSLHINLNATVPEVGVETMPKDGSKIRISDALIGLGVKEGSIIRVYQYEDISRANFKYYRVTSKNLEDAAFEYEKDSKNKIKADSEPIGVSYKITVEEMPVEQSKEFNSKIGSPVSNTTLEPAAAEQMVAYNPSSKSTTIDHIAEAESNNNKTPALEIIEKIDREGSNASRMITKIFLKSDVMREALAQTEIEYVESIPSSGKTVILGQASTSTNTATGTRKLIGIKISKAQDNESMEETIVHEVTHGLTMVLLRTPDSQLSNAQVAAKKELKKLYSQAKAQYKKSSRKDFDYQFSDIDEFVAGAFSNFAFQTYLANIEVKGPKNSVIGSMLSQFVEWVMELLGLESHFNDYGVEQIFTRRNSLLHQVLGNVVLLAHNDAKSKEEQVKMILEGDTTITLNNIDTSARKSLISDTLGKIIEKGKEYFIPTKEDGSEEDFYQKKGSKNIIQRVTDEVKGWMSQFMPKEYDKKGENWIDRKINTIFKDIKDPEEKIWIPEAEEKLDRKGAKAFFDHWSKYGTAKGKVIHGMIELATLNPFSTRNRAEIENQIKENLAVLDQDSIDYYKWVPEALKNIFADSRLKINFFEEKVKPEDRDVLLSETAVVNEDLGYASTPDMIVSHKDGTVSILDWKTGRSIMNNYEAFKMMYGDKFDYVFYNPMSKAKLEIMMRAVMMKMQNPALKFRNLAVIWVPNEYQAKGQEAVNPVEVANYLSMIESWMRDSKPAMYKALKKSNPNLFVVEDYNGKTPDLINKTLNTSSSTQKQIESLQAEIRIIINSFDDREKMPTWIREKVVAKMQQVIDMGESLGYDIKTWDSDIGNFDRFFGHTGNINHPVIQAYHDKLQKAKAKAREELQAKMGTFHSMLAKIMAAHVEKEGTILGKTLRGLTGLPLLRGLRKMTSEAEYKKLYGFMYKEVKEDGASIIKIVTEGDKEYKDLAKEGEIGKLKQSFITFVNDSFGEAFHERTGWLNKVAANKYNYDAKGNLESIDTKTYIDIYNESTKKATKKEFVYQRGMFPTVPPTSQDLIEQYGWLKSFPKRVQLWKDRNFSYYQEHTYEGIAQHEQMIPIKYLGSKRIRADKAHTFNMEIIFTKFMENMYQKKYGEDVAAFGHGLQMWLKYNRSDKSQYEKVNDFLDKQIDMQVRGLTKEEANISRKGLRDFKGRQFSFAKFLDSLRRFTSQTVLAGNIEGGLKNVVTAMLIAFRRAVSVTLVNKVVNKVYGAVGVEVEEVSLDYSLKNFSGLRAIKNMWAKAMQGDIRKDKTWLLLKHLDYLPSVSTWGSLSKNDLMSIKRKFLSEDTAYLTHSLGEEAVAATTLEAQLKSIKVNGKTMWDWYEVVEKKNAQGVMESTIEYKGPTRGYVKKGGELIELKGLDEMEIGRMRRIFTEMQGAYSDDQKTMMDYWAFGRAMLQFKRYFPAILKNGFSAKAEDVGIGSYKPKTDEKGNIIYKDGKELLQWSAEVQEGRWLVFGKVIANWMGSTAKLVGLDKIPAVGTLIGRMTNSDYNYKNLSQRDKLNLVEGWITLLLIATGWVIANAVFDEDDEEDPNLILLKTIIDNTTQQWNPKEVVKNSMYFPLPASFGKTYKTFDASSQFVFSWLANAEVSPSLFGTPESATTKDGEIEGAHQLMKSLPWVSQYYTNVLNAQKFGLFDESETYLKTFGAR